MLSPNPDATDTAGCVYTRSFASGTRVYVGQFVKPKIDRRTKASTNFGSCIYWSDGNVTSPNVADCPPAQTMDAAAAAGVEAERTGLVGGHTGLGLESQ